MGQMPEIKLMMMMMNAAFFTTAELWRMSRWLFDQTQSIKDKHCCTK